MRSESEAPIRRRSRLAPWLVVAVLAVVVTAVTAFRTDDSWRRFVAEVDSVIAEVETRLATDELPVFGEPVAGDAWPLYERALLSVDPDRLQQLADATDSEARAAIIAEHSIAIRSVAEGSRHTSLGRVVVWGSEPELQVLDALTLGDLLVASSEFGGHALETLASAIRFGRDVASNGNLLEHLVGSMIAQRAVAALGTAIAAGTIDPREYDRLDRFLADLDRGWPSIADSFRSESAGLGALLRAAAQRGEVSKELGVSRLSMWRHLFSDQRFVTDWWSSRATQQAVVERAATMPWSAAQAAIETVRRPPANDPLGTIAGPLEQFVAAPRDTRARIRIVREALAFLRSGGADGLADPFSEGPLRCAIDGPRLRVWSVGADGVDDGGLGSLQEGADPDLVLEIAR